MESAKTIGSKNREGKLSNPSNYQNGRIENTATGSATGTIRNKVALKPGHSLLDWIKLGHSGKDLTGVGGKYLTVTPEELAKHNSRDDAWIALKGQVYNVTHYFDFHPGGADELLKGVGMDATRLFNEVHAWVNVESMLQKCLVGKYKPSFSDSKSSRSKEGLSSLLFSKLKKGEPFAKKSITTDQSSSYEDDKAMDLPMPLIDWFQKPELFTLVMYIRRPGIGDSSPSVRVILKEESQVEVKVSVIKNGMLSNYMLLLNLKAPVVWPCTLSLTSDTGKVEVIFQKQFHEMWQNIKHSELLNPLEVQSRSNSDFRKKLLLNGKSSEEQKEWSWESEKFYQPYEVINIVTVTHDTKLFILKHESSIYDYIPIGYHVQLQAEIEGVIVERFYTPVSPALHSHFMPEVVTYDEKDGGLISPDIGGQWLFLLIKSTEGGALSPWLCNGGLNIGNKLNVSESIMPSIPDQKNKFPLPFHMGKSPLLKTSQNSLDLLLIAAGTGITPMVRIILWGLKLSSSQCKKITLLFFNKTEEDIIWREQMDKLMEDCDRFSAVYILSNPDVGWRGEIGIIRSEILEQYLTKNHSTSNSSKSSNVFTCVCGPTSFTRATEKLLHDFGVKENDYFCFLG